MSYMEMSLTDSKVHCNVSFNSIHPVNICESRGNWFFDKLCYKFNFLSSILVLCYGLLESLSCFAFEIFYLFENERASSQISWFVFCYANWTFSFIFIQASNSFLVILIEFLPFHVLLYRTPTIFCIIVISIPSIM